VSNANVQASFIVRFEVLAPPPVLVAPSNTHTFAEAFTGYGRQTRQTFSVNRVNNVATGVMTVGLSGENADSFVLVGDSLGSIGATSSTTRTFTVRPEDGLSAGVHTATLTVGGAGIDTQTVELSFTVIESVFDINVSQSGRFVFEPVTTGYGTRQEQTVSVLNIGNRPTGDLTIALSGDDATSFRVGVGSAFGSSRTLSSIPVDASQGFVVRPVLELASGTYNATVTISGSNIESVSFDLRLVVSEPPFRIGHVLGDDTIGIGDALAILRHLVGLDSVITTGSDKISSENAFRAALITNCTKPSIGCALEILRSLVGLPSVFDNPDTLGDCRRCRQCNPI